MEAAAGVVEVAVGAAAVAPPPSEMDKHQVERPVVHFLLLDMGPLFISLV